MMIEIKEMIVVEIEIKSKNQREKMIVLDSAIGIIIKKKKNRKEVKKMLRLNEKRRKDKLIRNMYRLMKSILEVKKIGKVHHQLMKIHPSSIYSSSNIQIKIKLSMLNSSKSINIHHQLMVR